MRLRTKPSILITGASGQLGLGLANRLQKAFGRQQVLSSDVRPMPGDFNFRFVDVLDKSQLTKTVVEREVTHFIHLSAILSYAGEKNINLARDVNMRGVDNVLDLAQRFKFRVFAPSTIGVYGKDTPKNRVPDLAVERPSTIYGISKVYLELLGQYYHKNFGVDFRSIRYPGILSADTEPGGGTTDYAIEIFHRALDISQGKKSAHGVYRIKYNCPLRQDQALPMMHVDDCLDGTVELITCDLPESIDRTFNIASVSFSPKELEVAIRKFFASSVFETQDGDTFQIDFSVDYTHSDPMRVSIADSWPHSLDDSRAREVWGWSPRITSTEQLVEKMFDQIIHAKKWSRHEESAQKRTIVH